MTTRGQGPGPLLEADLRAATQRILAAGWNAGNFDALDDLLTPSCRHYYPDGESTFSNEEYKAVIAAWAPVPPLHQLPPGRSGCWGAHQ
jgi:hypothetical protein